jgi:Ni/Fe-hydrogenase subunit HybB-like protein
MEAERPLDLSPELLEERSLAPLRSTSKGFYMIAAGVLLVMAWGAFAYSHQFRDGLYVTGMRDRILWGLYIAMFVFFIGASMGGTFVSGILRVTQVGWRTPVTRSAEMVTVAALVTAGLFIVLDLGRPDRMHHTVIFGRWESPLTWDLYGLTTYLVGSLIYLYAALIPDLAYCRDRIGPRSPAIRRWLYGLVAIGWEGNPSQRRYLKTALTVMMVLIVPVAVTMHTVTSWIFSMTLREPWDSALFGVYFVGGALYSGTGIIIILMAVLRKAYRLQDVITRKHFTYLAYMMAAFAMIMLFFNVNEFATHAYKLKGEISVYLREVFIGSLAIPFRFYFWGGIVVPVGLIALPVTRNIPGIVAAAVLVNIGMFIERYLIVVGGLMQPLNPYPVPSYSPTWVEWSLTAAGIGVFALIIALLLKMVPSVAVAEMLEDAERPT